MAGAAFDSAAARMGLAMALLLLNTYGQPTLQYLATQLGEVLDIDSPKSDPTQHRPIR